MTKDNPGEIQPPFSSDDGKSLIVQRSTVEAQTDYRKYKNYLRADFWFSCAYCTMCESEAGGHRFTIDHYEPRSARPDLETVYENLFYACDACNERKGDRCPPASARAVGYRIFRSDQEARTEHFEQKGIRLEAKGGSKVGDYTINALDLNRGELRQLRTLRRRLWEAEVAVSHGIMALRSFPIDRLPSHVKGAALRAINEMLDVVGDVEANVEKVLANYAMSAVLEDGTVTQEELERRKVRVQRLRDIQKEHPGNWRGRKA